MSARGWSAHAELETSCCPVVPLALISVWQSDLDRLLTSSRHPHVLWCKGWLVRNHSCRLHADSPPALPGGNGWWGGAVCALQQQVKITGCFIWVSKAAKRLLKHMSVPIFSLGFSLGWVSAGQLCRELSRAGKKGVGLLSAAQLLVHPGGGHVLQGEMWLGFLDHISSPCCYSHKCFTDCQVKPDVASVWRGTERESLLWPRAVDPQHMLMEKLNSGIHLTLMSLLISSVMASLAWVLLQCYNCWICICKWIVITQVS